MRRFGKKMKNNDRRYEMALRKLIDKRNARVGIIGVGYVGLPLAVEFAKEKFNVTGFEVDREKVKAINAGKSYIPDVPEEDVRQLVKRKKLRLTSDFKQLAGMNAIIICVPTPLRKTKDPDISYIVAAIQKIKRILRKGQLIILESTTYPGTTREVLLPVLEGAGVSVGKEFFLAFSPERVDPGSEKYGIKNTPKIVGGITPACTKLAAALYGKIIQRVVPVSTTESAEMVKLLENTFRAVNIGLVNEVALMCDRLKLDTWEVIDAAATKPFGFMPFYPGPGLGGHCIPLDPHYLSWKLKTLNFYSRFIELAGEINSHMPEYVIRKVGDGLNERGQSIKGARILVLGVAYKRDIGDVRESPALDVIEKLREKKARVIFHDPYADSIKVSGGERLKSQSLTDGLLSSQDCVVIATDHRCFDIKRIVKHAGLIVDSRNATKGIKNKKILKI